MPFNKNAVKKYVKGTMDVWCHNVATGNLDYYSNTVQSNQLTTNLNLGPINAGIGNPIVIQIPDSCGINLALTAADFSLEARQLSVGGDLTYNGITPYIESIAASGTTLTVTQTPVAPYGFPGIVGFVGDDGIAYTIDPTTKQVQGFTATSGTTYCVRYFIQSASAQQLAINTVFAPTIEIVTCRLPAYSTQGTSASQGTKCGDYYIWIPRMQFGGKADTDGSQTAASTTDISGTALSYEEAAASGACTESAITRLAYMVYVPADGVTSAVSGLAVVGGMVSVTAGGTTQCPVKYVMPDGSLVQPNYSDLTYSIPSEASSIATVSNTGLISGVGAGDTEITITLAEPSLTCVANVTVIA